MIYYVCKLRFKTRVNNSLDLSDASSLKEVETGDVLATFAHLLSFVLPHLIHEDVLLPRSISMYLLFELISIQFAIDRHNYLTL